MSNLKDESFFDEPIPEKKPSGFKWVLDGWRSKLHKFHLRMPQMEVGESEEATEKDKEIHKISDKPVRKQKNQLF